MEFQIIVICLYQKNIYKFSKIFIKKIKLTHLTKKKF